jgi:hypothetical protein
MLLDFDHGGKPITAVPYQQKYRVHGEFVNPRKNGATRAVL